MYGYPCTHCGNLEILHDDELDHFLESRYWPSLEYGESVSPEGFSSMFIHKPGYKNSIETCPGFKTKRGIPKEVLIRHLMDHPSTSPFVEVSIANEARRQLEELEDQRIASYTMQTSTVYLIPNKNGHYTVMIGE